MSDITKNDCQGEYMYSAEVPIEIELGSGGLYYGTSPSVKGLLVTGRSIKELMDKVPNAVAELKAVAAFAAEVSALKEKLKEATTLLTDALSILESPVYRDSAGARPSIHPRVMDIRAFLEGNSNG